MNEVPHPARYRAMGFAVAISFFGSVSPVFADTPYLGEIRVFGFDYCPTGFIPAAGQVLTITTNSALFSLMSVTYGGNGSSTFQNVDLQGRVAMGQGAGPGLTQRVMGEAGGQRSVTLTTANMPAHSHVVNANNLDGDRPGPAAKLLAAAPPNGSGSETIYSDQPATVTMAATMIAPQGQGQPQDITDPTLGMTVCVATQGVFPSRP